MSEVAVKIRHLQISDIREAMKLVVAESWNQTEKDWELLISGDGNICLAAEIDGRLVATATAINYDNIVAWIGMVLVNKKQRGRGISKLLLNALFEKLKTCQSIKLDATPAGQPVYKKLGFSDEYSISRMVNKAVNVEAEAASKLIPQKIKETDVAEIINFARRVFGAGRSGLIRILIKENQNKSLLLKESNKITGFVLGRMGNRFYQIGPLSASNKDVAIALVLAVLKELEGVPVVVDVPDDKQELIDWLSSIGFEKRRFFIRMFQHENRFPGEVESYYLIGGPEFG